MWLVPVMIYISWALENITWAYAALGVVILGGVFKYSQEQAAKKAASDQLQEAVGNLFRGIKATQN